MLKKENYLIFFHFHFLNDGGDLAAEGFVGIRGGFVGIQCFWLELTQGFVGLRQPLVGIDAWFVGLRQPLVGIRGGFVGLHAFGWNSTTLRWTSLPV